MGRGKTELEGLEGPEDNRGMTQSNAPFAFAVERVLFPKSGKSEDGFTIAKGQHSSERREVVCKGRYGPVIPGQVVEITRWAWREDSRFGSFIQVFAVSHSEPRTPQAVEAYLQNIHGVGEIWAQSIVNSLGTDCLEKIDQDPDILKTVRTPAGRALPEVTISHLKADWNELRRERKNMLLLSSLGLSDSQCKKVIEELGESVGERIKKNPYVLCQVPGIGFKTVDRLAQKAGVDSLDHRRLGAGLSYVISEMESDGHICLREEQLLHIAPQVLNRDGQTPTREDLQKAKEKMIQDGQLWQEEGPDGEPRVYTRENWIVETRLLGQLEKMLLPLPLPRDLQPRPKDSPLTEEQWAGVQNGLRERVSILTGGPGCGKTYTLKVMLDELDRAGDSYVCLAPTGKAAKRMEESTGREAGTIHSLLGFGGMRPPRTFSERGSGKTIDADVIIVDESSMLDMRVAERLLTHTKEGGRIVFVGDPDQLPAVGAGSVLHDLLESQRVPTTKLTKIFRQGQSSLLVVNAHRIREGKDPFWSAKEAEEELGHAVREDWRFVEVKNGEEARSVALREVEKVAEQLAVSRDEIMLTSGSKRGPGGVHALNKDLQEKYNPGGEEIRSGQQPLRVGDRVMNTKNRYAGSGRGQDIMNGDSGVISRWDKRVAWIDFGFGDVPFTRDELEQIIPAYAATTHKLQGSEFPGVINTVADEEGSKLLSRNLLYTAQTRAGEMCVVVGRKSSVRQALKRDGSRRNTTLDLRVGAIEPRLKTREEVALDIDESITGRSADEIFYG